MTAEAQELIELIKRGTGSVEKPTLEKQLDAICDSLTGLVIEHQRLSAEADKSKNRYKKLFAQTWAQKRTEPHDKGTWTAKDVEQATILATSTEELIADLDDTLARTQGELVDVVKMILAGKRSLLQSVLAEYHNTNGGGGLEGNGVGR